MCYVVVVVLCVCVGGEAVDALMEYTRSMTGNRPSAPLTPEVLADAERGGQDLLATRQPPLGPYHPPWRNSMLSVPTDGLQSLSATRRAAPSPRRRALEDGDSEECPSYQHDGGPSSWGLGQALEGRGSL